MRQAGLTNGAGIAFCDPEMSGLRNRARDIRQAGSISFKTCSEDTASITALNEFYEWRVFDGFKAEHRDEKELKIGMMRSSRDFESFSTMEPRLRSFICAEPFVVGRADETLGGLATDAQYPESDWSSGDWTYLSAKRGAG